MIGIDQLLARLRNSLHTRAVVAGFVPMAAASLCLLAAFAAVLFMQLYEFHTELQLRAQSLAESLSRQSGLAVLADRAELDRIARAVAAVDSVLYVVVDGPAGDRLVTITNAPFPSTDIPATLAGGSFTVTRDASSKLRFVDVRAPIRQSNSEQLLDWDDSGAARRPLGQVRVGLSTEKYYVMLRRSLWSLAALGILSLFLTLTVQHRQMRRILSPLKDLIAFTRRVAHGDLTQRAAVVRNDDVGRLAVACNRMVQNLDRSRRELLQTIDIANEASRLKSQFLANMSHEIRTPLNGMIGMTELALDSGVSADAREQLITALNSAQALLVVLNDILDLSKIEAGKLGLESICFNAETVVEQAARALAVQAHRKGLELICDVAPDVPLWVHGDPDRLRQVLTNLISNAVKFTSDGEVVVTVRCESEDGDQLRFAFAVKDTGIGVPQDKQAVIFEPFTQADGSMTRRYGGTGLGLTICARLVEMMGGRIGISSELGVGSTFHFTSVFARAADPNPAKHEAELVSLVGIRTLIVDDNETNRRILTGMLKGWHMDVESAESGPAGIVRLRSAESAGRPFRLVIIDAMMPGMDGLETARHMRSLFRVEPSIIMMLSSGATGCAGQTCGDVAITRSVMKPVTRSELLDIITSVMSEESERFSEAQAEVCDYGVADQKALSILVAEDNQVNQQVVQIMLRKAGHRVKVVKDGAEALVEYARQTFDLILMDVQMPNMDGWEATRQIRMREKTAGARIPIIALTAHAFRGDCELCIKAGMDAYVAKPISRTQLFRAIDKVANRENMAVSQEGMDTCY